MFLVHLQLLTQQSTEVNQPSDNVTIIQNTGCRALVPDKGLLRSTTKSFKKESKLENEVANVLTTVHQHYIMTWHSDVGFLYRNVHYFTKWTT